MDLNKLTQKSQESLLAAQNLAVRMGHQAVDVEHLLLALCEQEGGLIPRLFERLQRPADVVVSELRRELQKRPSVTGPGASGAGPGQVSITNELQQVFVEAETEAGKLKDEYVSVEHLLLAILKPGGPAARSAAHRILAMLGITRDSFLKALTDVRGNQRVVSANPEATYEALARYGRDLVADCALPQRGTSRTARSHSSP